MIQVSHLCQAIGNRRGRGLLPFEVMERVDEELKKPKFASECTPAYLETIRDFVVQHIAQHLASMRKSRGMFEALERSDEWDSDTDLSMGASGMHKYMSVLRSLTRSLAASKAIVDNKAKVTESQLQHFLTLCWQKYVKARIEPGK
jgi:DNA-directed RNA polymerase III subunit RPC1